MSYFDVIIGDTRRCPAHPRVSISSPDGLHDTLCGLCEYEADRAADMARETLPLEWDTTPPKIHINDDDIPF